MSIRKIDRRTIEGEIMKMPLHVLQKLVKLREDNVAALLIAHNKLMKHASTIVKQIELATGSSFTGLTDLTDLTTEVVQVPKPGKNSQNKPVKSGSLVRCVIDLFLDAANKPMDVVELADAVLASGHKTSRTAFGLRGSINNVMWVMNSKEPGFFVNKEGCWKLGERYYIMEHELRGTENSEDSKLDTQITNH